MTPTRRQYFAGLTVKAFKTLISEKIAQRLQSAMDGDNTPVEVSVSSSHPVAQSVEIKVENTTDTGEVERSEKNLIVTTEDELEGFHIVKAILRQQVDLQRIVARDTQSYFGILLDDNNRKPLARLHFNRTQKYLGLFDEQRQETRIPISDLNEIYAHADQLSRVLAFYEGTSGETAMPNQN